MPTQLGRSCICQTHRRHNPILCITPPHILRHLARQADGDIANAAFRTLALSASFGGRRAILSGFSLALSSGGKRRTVYDAGSSENLPGRLVRSEGGPGTGDSAADEAYDAAGDTYDFYKNVFSRDSVDGKGLPLDSSVHYSTKYDNAFWNGNQMVYGDGDGSYFNRFTIALDVIGHELTHGVTQYTAALEYQDQPGALNESMSDCFGSMVKQFKLKQTATQADWLIGKGLFTPKVQGRALRDMVNPGTAYNDPNIGPDPQPSTMAGYVNTSDDNGGVHINSGIPNRAFALAAIAMKGKSWETVGPVWYEALTKRLTSHASFADAANATIDVAASMGGASSALHKAVLDAWVTVGVIRQSGGSAKKPKKRKKA